MTTQRILVALLAAALAVPACADDAEPGDTQETTTGDADSGEDAAGGDAANEDTAGGDAAGEDTAGGDAAGEDTAGGNASDGGAGDGDAAGTDTAPFAAPVVGIGPLATVSHCAGSAIDVPVSLSPGDAVTVLVSAELSGPDGNFDAPRVIGSATFAGDGVIAGVLPADLPPGESYRLRAVADGAEPSTSDQSLTVFGLAEVDVDLTPRHGFVGDVFRVSDNTVGVVSRTWTFPADADVPTSTEAITDVSFSELGVKAIGYDGLTSDGCVVSELFDTRLNSIEVVGCEVAIPDTAEVITDTGSEKVGGSYHAWMCGGSQMSGFGGIPTLFIEPGAVFDFDGGGAYTVYVKSGGSFVSNSPGGSVTVIHEPGAVIVDHPQQSTLECQTLTFDANAGPAGGCVPEGVAPDSVAITTGELGTEPICPGTKLDLDVTVSGQLGASNLFIAQLSDATGDYGNGQLIGVMAGTSSKTVPIALPAPLPAGTDYRVRVFSSHPPSIGTETAPFEVQAAAVAGIDVLDRKALVGEPVRFATAPLGDTSIPFVSADWDFGDNAQPAIGSGESVTTTYATAGQKTVTLSTVDAGGCATSATVAYDEEVYQSGVEILGCSITVPSDAEVYGPGVADLQSGASWVCGGAQTELFGGVSTAVVEEHGELDFRGGGRHTFYVRAGGLFTGGSGGDNALVYESGALVADIEQLAFAFECPVLEVDVSEAPTPGCQPFDPPPPSITIGEPQSSAVCTGAGFSLPLATTGIFPPSNTFHLELSDSSGSFASPVRIGSTSSAAGGTISGRINAGDVADGTGYRLRVVSDDPPVTSEPATTVLTVSTTPDVTVVGDYFVVSGEPLTLTLDPPAGVGETVSWEIDGVEVSTEVALTTTLTDYRFYSVDVTVTTAAGCVDDRNHPVRVVGCEPTIEANAEIVTEPGATGFGGAGGWWICDGGEVSASAGSYGVYVESGGEFNFTSGGVYAAYVLAGGTYNGAPGGLRAVISEPGATVALSGSEQFVLECPAITFDTSIAPPAGCP